jgi:drug/metabolite transporter (DMT)-like permease
MTGGTDYAFAALVCYGVGDFIYKSAIAAGVKPRYFLMGQAWCFTPAIILYAWLTGTLVVGPASAWGGLAGFFIFIGFYNFLRSLAGGSVSVSAPVFRLNFIITALLAIVVLGEPVRLAMSIALALALVAIWLLLGSERGQRPEIDRRALGAVLVATLAFGIGNFCHTMGVRQGAPPETLLAAQAVVFIVLATAFVRIIDGKIAPPAMMWKYTASAAAVLIFAFLFMLHGVAQGPASVLIPIAQMGFVVTAALGIVVLREPLTVRKGVGLAAAVAALAALAIG